MQTIYYKNLKSKELSTREKLRKGSWINIENPSRDELRKFALKMNIDEDWVEDVLDPFEAPRIEVEEDGIYIFTRCPQQIKDEIVSIPILIVLTEEYIITISSKKLPFLQKLIQKRSDVFTTQKVKLLLIIISEIYKQYDKFVLDINKNIKRNRINLEKISNKNIIQLIQYEETINEFLTDLVPTEVILKQLLSGTHFKLYEEDEDLIEDLILYNNELLNLCRAKIKSLTNIRSAYSTIMTNNLNRVMRTLTGLTVILMFPTIITSLYGMNVALPFAQSPLAFNWIIGATGFITFFLLLVFFRKKWF